MSQTWLFDLDGTLIDSIELIGLSFEFVAESFDSGWAPGYWRSYLGQTLDDTFRTLLDGDHEREETPTVKDLIDRYREHNLEHHDARVRSYPGVSEAIDALAGRADVRLGVVTSKRSDVAIRGLECCGLDGIFELVLGSDLCVRHKPHPGPIHDALEQMGVTSEAAFYVGDSPYDIQAGNAAGVTTVAVKWGPFDHADLAAQNPDHWAEAPDELLGLSPVTAKDDTRR